MVTAGVTADIIVGSEHGMGRHLSINEPRSQFVAILKVRTLFLHHARLDEWQLTYCSWSTCL